MKLILLCPSWFCSGIYGDAITVKALKDFHRRRVQVLADSGADLIAFETTPNKIEAQVLTFLIIYTLAHFPPKSKLYPLVVSSVLNFIFFVLYRLMLRFLRKRLSTFLCGFPSVLKTVSM